MELGDEIGPLQRVAPGAPQVASYIGSVSGAGQLFVDADYARSLGFRGIVVPGAMLSGYLEQLLREALHGWRLEQLSVTFRIPTTTGDVLTLHGVITERHDLPAGTRLVCDLVIEHADGERAVTGTATLRVDI